MENLDHRSILVDSGTTVHCRLIWCPVGGLAGGCGAGCISQDTYLLYDIHDNVLCLVQLLYVAMRYSDKRDIHDT